MRSGSLASLLAVAALFGSAVDAAAAAQIGPATALRTRNRDNEVPPEKGVFAVSGSGSGSPASTATRRAPLPLRLWKDPEFQRRFQESYLSETDVEPTVTLAERDQMQEILELMSEEKVERAFAELEEARKGGSSAVFDFTLANFYFERDELAKAREIYADAIAKHPKFRRAWQNLGWLHVRDHNFAAARVALTKTVELGGGTGMTYGLLGFVYSNLQDYVPAESAYRMAVLLEPETIDWQLGLAESFYRQERYADAVALFGDMIARNPDSADLWEKQARAYALMGKPLKAAENLEFVDELGGASAEGLNLLGNIYVNEELYDLAAASYVRALDLSPEDGLGRALAAAKALAARNAIAETEQVVDRIAGLGESALTDGQRTDLLRIRARVAMAEGAGEAEARILEQLVELDPLDGDALIQLGDYSRRMDDPDQAIFYYQRAAGIEAFEARANRSHAQLLASQGKFSEAVALLRRAQKLDYKESVQGYLERLERAARTRG